MTSLEELRIERLEESAAATSSSRYSGINNTVMEEGEESRSRQPSISGHQADINARRRLFLSQPSTVALKRQQAVCVRRAHKMYGSTKNPNVVLDGLNMTVPKGAM